jgi:hypothetical protein
VVTVAHRNDSSFFDRAGLVFPVGQQVRQGNLALSFCREEPKADAQCIRSSTVDLGQPVECQLLVGIEANGRGSHVSSVAQPCYEGPSTRWAGSLGVDARLVRIAIEHAAEHLDEIEERLRQNDAAADRVRKLTAARSSVLAG